MSRPHRSSRAKSDQPTELNAFYKSVKKAVPEDVCDLIREPEKGRPDPLTGLSPTTNPQHAALVDCAARPPRFNHLYRMAADPNRPTEPYARFRALYNHALERYADLRAGYAADAAVLARDAEDWYARQENVQAPLGEAEMRRRYLRFRTCEQKSGGRITMGELTNLMKKGKSSSELSGPARRYFDALTDPLRTADEALDRLGEVPAPVPPQVRLELAHWFGYTGNSKTITRAVYLDACPWQLLDHVPELALLRDHVKAAAKKRHLDRLDMTLPALAPTPRPLANPNPVHIPANPVHIPAPAPSASAVEDYGAGGFDDFGGFDDDDDGAPGPSNSGHHGGGRAASREAMPPPPRRADRSRQTREGTQQSYGAGGLDDFGGFDDDDDGAPGQSSSGGHHGDGRAASREAMPPPPRMPDPPAPAFRERVVDPTQFREKHNLAVTSEFHTLSSTIQKSKSLSGKQRDMWKEGNIRDTNRLDPATNADLAGLVDFVARPPHFIHLDNMAMTDPEEGGYPDYKPLWRHARAAKVAMEQEYADKLARFNARAERHYRQPGCRVRVLTRHEMRERFKKMLDTPRPTPGSNRLKTFKSLMQSKATKTLSEIAKEAVLFFFDPLRTAADPRQRLGDLPGADVLCPDLGRELAAWFSEVAKKKLGRIEYLDVLPEPIFVSFPELDVLRDHFHDVVRGDVSKNHIWLPEWVPRGGEGGGEEPSPPESGHHHRRHHQQQQQPPQPQPSLSQQQAPPPSLPQQQQAHYQQEDLYGTPTPPRQLQPQQQQQPHQAAAYLEPPAQPELRRSSSSKRPRYETTSSSSSSDDDDEVEVISASRHHRRDDRDDRAGGGRKKSSRDKQSKKSRDKDASSSSRTQPSGSSSSKRRAAAPAPAAQPSALGRLGRAFGLGGSGGASSSSSSSRHPHSSSSTSNRQQPAERSGGGGGGGHSRSSREAAAAAPSSSRRNTTEPSSSSSRRTSGGGSSRRDRHRDDPTTPSAPVANMAPLPEYHQQQLQPGEPSQMMPAAAHYQSTPVPTPQTLVSRPAAPIPGSGVVAYAPPLLEVVHSTDGGNTLRGAHGGGAGGGYNDNYGQYHDGGGHRHHDPNAYRR